MATGDGDFSREPIEDRAELVAYMEAGSKPRERWRVGAEHEKIAFHTGSLTPVPYDGPSGIAALLNEMGKRYGWQPQNECGNVIALYSPEGRIGGSITLEPGGQFELSGAPMGTLHEISAELATHLQQANEVGAALGIGFLGAGFSPKWTLAETPSMPKSCYHIMTGYLPKVGTLGLNMMYQSCTVQTNLDYSSEADMVKKLRVGLALQPIVTALFANSPFTGGRPNGFLSFRGEIWRHTDNSRTGLLPFAFEDGMGFERYVDYSLDVPMFCVFRGGRYLDTAGASFRDFIAGRVPQLPGERATLADWTDHLTTLYPEVRLKRYIEMRGADAGTFALHCALPAIWTGLLYDDAALNAAWALARDWTAEEREGLRNAVPRLALKAEVPLGGRNRKVLDVARDMVAIARQGLTARARSNPACEGETRYLEPLEAIAASGVTPAEVLLAKYAGEWGESVDPMFETEKY